ncbi:Threonine/homoserine/homoserine lactone efflux protein [Roseivivax marinus]|jgi:threonine/homoserine/homoserine lactone efflux protein|uniref:LysE family translocator n=1 Tax=Roseivivax marinus TaxID=1379903 RepID=UPI0008C79E51|nr:LysE family translocator [Roseivivax marinus]SEK52543.1 Threonine/homoserine/homoserine lactone efflux protein [Roseivivax marinus]
MLPDAATLVSFLGAGLVLNLTPGADVMFAMASGARGGVRAGVAAAFGVSLGCLFHVALTAAGVAALLRATPAAFDALRYAGAAYLVVLAVRAWRADPSPTGEGGAATLGRAVLRGALTNVLNPKVALFILAFLPQFADPARGPVWTQLLALGGLFAATGFAVTGLYGAAGGALRSWLASRARLLNRISAAVFAGLAARLAFA